MTEEQRRALARAFSASVAPAFANLQKQLAQSTASVIALSRIQEQIAKAIQPQLQELQLNIAQNLRVQVQSYNAQILSAFTPEVVEAFRRISKAANTSADATDTLPTEQGLHRLDEIVDSEEISNHDIESVEQLVDSDEQLLYAVDQAAESLSISQPWLSRERARQIVVVWVYILWSAGLVAASFVPIVGAIPGAIGLDSKTVSNAAGKGFDRLTRSSEDNKDEETRQAGPI
ncbi:hypothetical protein [Paractinoplanes maris]|uniref:hypothetical protein n=1 Tax=Paractinoplanes maris TaxID=1734446 RepID=UPI0020207D43|nr:hypothetical protein [Actinoplanes maris]